MSEGILAIWHVLRPIPLLTCLVGRARHEGGRNLDKVFCLPDTANSDIDIYSLVCFIYSSEGIEVK